MFETTESRVSTVRKIGAGERLSAVVTEAVLSNLPEGFDHKADGAVAELVHNWINGDTPAPAVTSGGKRTDYGTGVNTIVTRIKRELNKAADAADETPKPVVLRVSLSGEGGGSTVIEPSHPFYEALFALFTGEAEADQAA